jgi:hypothetical protein
MWYHSPQKRLICGAPTANGIPTTIGVTCVSTRIVRAVNVCDTYTKVELQVQ